MNPPCYVIFEDENLLALNKPAGLVCHPTKDGEWSSLVGRIRLHLGPASAARLVNRLDRETSGVILAAKNATTAGLLGQLWETRAVEKNYSAIVHGHLRDDSGVIDFPLGKDEASIVAVKDCVRADGAPATTEYQVERRFLRPEGKFTLVNVRPRTGRKHQIRIHLAALGYPIVGDKLYGGDEDIYLALAQDRLTAAQREKMLLTNQALHAASLRFEWFGEMREFRAEPSREFAGFADGLPRGLDPLAAR